MARRNFAAVLAEMIEEGSTSPSTAIDVAQDLFPRQPGDRVRSGRKEGWW